MTCSRHCGSPTPPRAGGVNPVVDVSLAADGTLNTGKVFFDVTDRVLAEEKLRAEERTLRKLLDLQDQERKLIAYEIHDGMVQERDLCCQSLVAAHQLAEGTIFVPGLTQRAERAVHAQIQLVRSLSSLRF